MRRAVDTSAWIELFDDSPIGRRVRREIAELDGIIVPTIVQLELAVWMTREVSEAISDEMIAFTNQCIVVQLDTRLAMNAAEVRRQHRLATADAIIYATALAHNADLLTCDAHFRDLPGVVYFAKTGE